MASSSQHPSDSHDLIHVQGARENNLKDVSVAIPKRRLTVFTGVILGVLVSLSSVGAGALGVTVLIFLYPRLPIAQIVGSDIAHAVPLTLCAGIGHWFIGSVDFPLLGSLLLGSIPGIMIGSQLASHVPEWVLRPVLAVMLIASGSVTRRTACTRSAGGTGRSQCTVRSSPCSRASIAVSFRPAPSAPPASESLTRPARAVPAVTLPTTQARALGATRSGHTRPSPANGR